MSRPYFITLAGTRRLIEATSPANAVQIAVGGGVTELRPARANEVTAWIRGGGSVETEAAPIDPTPVQEDPTKVTPPAVDNASIAVDEAIGETAPEPGLPGDDEGLLTEEARRKWYERTAPKKADD